MKIIMNGVEHDCDCASLLELWNAQAREQDIASPRGFAMALNGQLVRREQWPKTSISAGDRIEIVRAFAGG